MRTVNNVVDVYQEARLQATLTLNDHFILTICHAWKTQRTTNE